MKKHLLVSLIFGLVCSVSLAAQGTQRVEVEKASISFIPTSFLVKKNDYRFSASGERFGGIAFLAFTPAGDLAPKLPSEADVKDFEAQIKTSAVQKVFSDSFAQGLHASGLVSFTAQKWETATFHSLPAVEMHLSGTLDEIAYQITAFMVFNPKLKKLYTISWMCNEKYFEVFSSSLQPSLDSIEFK